MDKSLSLRIELDDDQVELFQRIKKEHNFKTNTECIRYCISVASSNEGIKIDPEYFVHIQNLLLKKFVRTQFLVFSVQDVVRKALDVFIQEIQSSFPSLDDWNVKKSLTEDELSVALCILKLQAGTDGSMVSEADIMDSLPQLTKKQVRDILEDFVSQSFVERTHYSDKLFYHAH